MFGLALVCPSVDTFEFSTLNLQATKHPPLATSLNKYDRPPTPLPTKNLALHYTLAQMYCHEDSMSNTIIKNIF
jgi:hypothetical protein